jgi:hypothetical protein
VGGGSVASGVPGIGPPVVARRYSSGLMTSPVSALG